MPPEQVAEALTQEGRTVERIVKVSLYHYGVNASRPAD